MTPASPTGRTWLLGVVTTLLCTAALWALHLDAFIPHDEGMLGQSAERVLAGELPHLDFDETYTGGMAFLHAALFEVFGPRSAVLRHALLVASAFFLFGFFALAVRHFDPWVAAGLTVLAAAWSLACFFAAMPSWYNLFLAVGALLALDHLRRSEARWPIFVAGLCGGCSILFKIIGLYLVGAAALVVVHDLQVRCRARDDQPRYPSGAFGVWLAALLATLGLGLVVVLRRAPSWFDFSLFATPIVAIGVWLVVEETRPKNLPADQRWPELARRWGLLALGVVIPLALFSLPFLQVDGGWRALLRGLFVLPQLRFEFAQLGMPPWQVQWIGLPIVALFWGLGRRRFGWAAALATVAFLATWLIWGRRGELGHVVFWAMARNLLPLFVLAILVRWWRSPSAETRWPFQVLAVASLFNLIQFPVSSQQYLHYTLPLTVLVLGIWLQGAGAMTPARRVALAATGVAFYVFAALWVHFSSPFALGLELEPKLQKTWLAEYRVGLRVTAASAELYRRLITFTQQEVPPEQPILALPDCPEVYFFTQRKNPTRWFFDALSEEQVEPGRLASWLQQVGLVVIHREPKFSPPISAATEAAIVAAFPERLILGPYEVRYRRR